MKGLTIDVGNTAIKFATFEFGKITKFKRQELVDVARQIDCELKSDYDYIALCSVKPSVLKLVRAEFPQISIIDSDNYDDMIGMYLGNPPRLGSFSELGSDIAIGCYGALSDGFKDVIVIDSGTATTVTAVVNGVIEAVYICPGFRLSKMSLFGGAEALEGDYSLKIKSGRATNTEACIDLGIYHGANGAAKQIIEQIENMYERKFKVYITGGDAADFYIDAFRVDDKLVNIGLDRYMQKQLTRK